MEKRIDPTKHFFSPVVEDANFSIYIGGLVVMNMQAHSWQGVFIDGIENHDMGIGVYVYHKGKLQSRSMHPLRAVEEGRMISISGLNTKPRHTTVSSTAVQHLSNIADFSQLHGLGLSAPQKVKFENSRDNRRAKLTKVEIDGGYAYSARFAQFDEGKPDNYCFERLDPPPSSKSNWGPLGDWIGIDRKIPKNGTVKLELSNSASNFSEEFVIRSDMRVCVAIDNMCDGDGCVANLDFPYYYRTERDTHFGIVNETPVVMSIDRQLPIQIPKVKGEMKIFRVACNATLVSQMDIPSLFDLAD